MVVDKIMTASRMRYSVSIKDATKAAKHKDINPPMSFTQAEDLIKSLVYKGEKNPTCHSFASKAARQPRPP